MGWYPGLVNKSPTGHREVEHTADWELEVWAPDMPALLEEAARGMYELMNVELAGGPRQHRRIVLDAGDLEQLLVEFLDELLYLGESEELGCDRFRLAVEGARLEAMVEGVPIVAHGKEIKAVTYHRLEIEETEDGLQTRIVFDV